MKDGLLPQYYLSAMEGETRLKFGNVYGNLRWEKGFIFS